MKRPIPQTFRSLLVALTIVALPTAAFAQFDDGGLGQQTQRAMESAMDDLFNADQGPPTAESLQEKVGKEKVDAFIQNAVVKLTFLPEGAYTAEALEGGEVIFFKIGKEKFTPSEDEQYADGWLTRTGEYNQPKKAQKLVLQLKAGPTEVTVNCHNKYSQSEQPITFYVGPLDGLFCVGFTEEEMSEGDDQVG